MRRENMLARVLRAVTDKTQERMAAEIGVKPNDVAFFELGKEVPTAEHLEAMARIAGIDLAGAEEILRLYEMRRRGRQRWGGDPTELLDQLTARLRAHLEATYERFLTLPRPQPPPKPEDRERAEELFSRLQDLAPELRPAVVEVAEEYQDWALCERVCQAAEEAASDLTAAAAWAQLAQAIAERVRGEEAWRLRVQGYAAAHAANVLQRSGELAAAALFAESRRLWESGSDPAGLLDGGRVFGREENLDGTR